MNYMGVNKMQWIGVVQEIEQQYLIGPYIVCGAYIPEKALKNLENAEWLTKNHDYTWKSKDTFLSLLEKSLEWLDRYEGKYKVKGFFEKDLYAKVGEYQSNRTKVYHEVDWPYIKSLYVAGWLRDLFNPKYDQIDTLIWHVEDQSVYNLYLNKFFEMGNIEVKNLYLKNDDNTLEQYRNLINLTTILVYGFYYRFLVNLYRQLNITPNKAPHLNDDPFRQIFEENLEKGTLPEWVWTQKITGETELPEEEYQQAVKIRKSQAEHHKIMLNEILKIAPPKRNKYQRRSKSTQRKRRY